ncbi:LysR family transcriptional regulator [Massilia sp. W12]|uniref:LysR family transcriptional regulator n=1 Tax=Massilia sp. W12 TaxID=3126507 RepID=UPI0030D305CB
MQNEEDLNDFRLVALICASASLAGAARSLGCNHATVFRRLQQFEQRLGVALFERHGGRYIPTAAGEEVARAGDAMQELLAGAMRKVSGQDARLSGEVRISTTDSLAAALLPALLQACRASYPLIRLDVQIDNRAANLSRRDADIALRTASAAPEHLIGKRVGMVQFAVYGAAGVSRAANWAECDWLGLDESFAGHRTLRWLEHIIPLDALALRCNTFVGLQHACAAGLGLCLLPCHLGDANPALRRCSAPVPECAVNLWLLTHPDLRQTVRVKAVYQFLLDGLQQRLASADPLQ